MELTAFELSYIYENIPIEVDEEGYLKQTDKLLEISCEKLRKIKKVIPNTHLDGGSFEVNSPVFYDKDTAIEYYYNTTKLMKNLGLVTHSNKMDGGGLHIHVNMPTCYLNTYTHMCYIINRLPYLNWIFNNPIDTWNGNNPYLNFKEDHKDARFKDYDKIALNILRGSKSNPIRFEESGTNRVEYRFFDMPYNKNEFDSILTFVGNLHHYLILREWPDGTLENNEFSIMKKKSMDFMVDKFKTLLKYLGLDYRNYDIFVERNMKTRYKYGKEYLV